jgi:hypothetical protein
MDRRTRRTLLIVAGVLLLLAIAIFLRSKAPPEAARLLPESDGIVYFDIKPIRTFLHKDLKPPQRAPDYQQFVDATGIDWEQDLDQVAIALHRMPDPNGPNGPVAYSMVLVGKLTGKRLNSWLESNATSRETYAGHTIYNIHSQDRTVRVTQIGYDMIAVSNTPTPEQIHSMIDRHRTAAWPFSNSSLLNQHYRDVPLLSLVWGIGQIGLPFSESGAISIFGFSLPLQSDSIIVASLRWTGSLHLRVEEIAPTQDKAANQAAALATIVTLARGFTSPLGDTSTNNSLKELLKTAEITQKQERVIVTATLPSSFLTSLSQDVQPTQTQNSPSSSASQPAPNASK